MKYSFAGLPNNSTIKFHVKLKSVQYRRTLLKLYSVPKNIRDLKDRKQFKDAVLTGSNCGS